MAPYWLWLGLWGPERCLCVLRNLHTILTVSWVVQEAEWIRGETNPDKLGAGDSCLWYFHYSQDKVFGFGMLCLLIYLLIIHIILYIMCFWGFGKNITSNCSQTSRFIFCCHAAILKKWLGLLGLLEIDTSPKHINGTGLYLQNWIV